jgi:hypothetical protein
MKTMNISSIIFKYVHNKHGCIISMTVSAILEHEAIAGLSTGKPSGLRGRALGSSSGPPRGSVTEEKSSDLSLDLLIKAVSH